MARSSSRRPAAKNAFRTCRSASPTRANLCAGVGHFGAANIPLTNGLHTGGEADAAERLSEQWDGVRHRRGKAVPEYGFFEAEREPLSAQAALQRHEPVTSVA